MSGSYEQCVTYPVPAGYHWPRKTIEAFCADSFTKSLNREDMDQLINSGRGKDLDSRLDNILGDYLAGKSPEGTAFHVYANFARGDDATARLVARWLDQSQRSAHAFAARGIHHLRRGMDARGSEYIQNTPRAN